MKARRLFQVASALLAMIFAITFIAAGIIAIFSYVNKEYPESVLGNNKFGWFFVKLALGFRAGSEAKFMGKILPQGDLGFILFDVILLLGPAVLLLLASLILFSKPGKKGKQGFHIFGCILAILGIAIFAFMSEFFAKDIILELPEEAEGVVIENAEYFFENGFHVMWMIVCGAASGLLLFLLILALISKKPQPVLEEEQQPAPEEQPKAFDPFEPNADADDTVHTDTTNRIVAMEVPEPQPVVEQPAPAQQDRQNTTPASEYVPDDQATVRDIVDHTYGGQFEDISQKNLEKIQTLRSLLDAGAITKDEYITLVNSYLGLKPTK